MKNKPALTVWSISISRDYGGEFWHWPRLERLRIGWRWTAWGLHFGATRQELSREQTDAIIQHTRTAE